MCKSGDRTQTDPIYVMLNVGHDSATESAPVNVYIRCLAGGWDTWLESAGGRKLHSHTAD
jgi:hypothetical protein